MNKDYTYETVIYGDGTSFANLPWYSEIIIHGHGGKGIHVIGNDHAATSRIKYDDLADRVISHGLKKTWSGAIKLHNCYSGCCTLGSQSFAAKFAQHMRFKKNYHLVSYVGYMGPIDTRPEDMGGVHKHKYVTNMFGGETKSKWMKAFF